MEWKLGDDVNTDQLAPNNGSAVLSSVLPNFAANARHGDIIIAGENFGCGSNRERAVRLLRQLGIVEVRAKSFAYLFYRNAVNTGLRLSTTHTGVADEIVRSGSIINYIRNGGLR